MQDSYASNTLVKGNVPHIHISSHRVCQKEGVALVWCETQQERGIPEYNENRQDLAGGAYFSTTITGKFTMAMTGSS